MAMALDDIISTIFNVILLDSFIIKKYVNNQNKNYLIIIHIQSNHINIKSNSFLSLSLSLFLKVGEWFDSGLYLEMEKIFFGTTSDEHESQINQILVNDTMYMVGIPESICSKPCKLGQIKIVQAGDRCCWICTNCRPYEYVYNESHCLDCGEGRWPYPDKQSCYDLQLRYMKWGSMYSNIACGVSVVGMVLCSLVIYIFIKYGDTPIVKASGRELSFILLGGMMGCFLCTYVLIAKPTLITCALQRFVVRPCCFKNKFSILSMTFVFNRLVFVFQ